MEIKMEIKMGIKRKREIQWFKFYRKVFEHKQRKSRLLKDNCWICTKRFKEEEMIGDIIININGKIGLKNVHKRCYINSRRCVK